MQSKAPHKNFLDLTGKKFGDWTVIKPGPPLSKRTRFYCECVCKNVSLVLSCNLTGGKTKSCRKCSKEKRDDFHGMSKSKTYSVYIQMVERCHSKNHRYFYRYGGRNIFVCEEWRSDFKRFLSDMGEAPKNLTLDRIDNDKGYCKENCRWTTRKTQSSNRSNSIQYGEISNGWEIVSLIDGNKTYNIRCTQCSVIVSVKSCNFRKRHKHNCKVGE